MNVFENNCARCRVTRMMDDPIERRKVRLLAIVGMVALLLLVGVYEYCPHIVEVLVALYAVYFGFSLLLYLKRNIIGRYVYAFLADGDELHVHDTDPRDENSRRYSQKHFTWTDYLCELPIFQLRVGGWFGKSQIIGKGGSDWRIVEGRNGEDPGILDWAGNVLLDVSLDEKSPGLQLLLRLAPKYNGMKMVVRRFYLLEDENKKLRDRRKLLEEMTEARDNLGIECQKLIALMEESRETLGRSKHAKLFKDRLEEMMARFPPELVKEWKQRAWQARKSA